MKVFKQYQKMSKEKEIFAHLKEMYAVRTRLSTGQDLRGRGHQVG